MDNLGHSCLVDSVEQALLGESALSSEATGVKSLEHGCLNVVVGRYLGKQVMQMLID